MLDNSCYNKIKLMHDLSALIWFIKKHAGDDAQKASDKTCIDLLNKLEEDLDRHLHQLKHMICEQQNALCSARK